MHSVKPSCKKDSIKMNATVFKMKIIIETYNLFDSYIAVKLKLLNINHN